MYKSCLVLMLSFGWSYFIGVHGKCPPDDASQIIEYIPIPKEQYDRNFSSISDIGKRPLGFDKAVWLFNKPGENPCVKITGAKQRHIEIAFETHPSSRLCVKDQNSQPACSDAGTGTHYECRSRSAKDTVYFEFFCDQGEEYDVRFWYRLVLGDLPADDPENHWCDLRSTEYPLELLELGPNFTFKPRTTASPDTALTLYPSFMLLFALLGLTTLAFFKLQ
ncbi:hypothetical protein RRG08_050703 [Elysia crispata]|uniref:Uncharacterized protein n=1 Tax=Elysia crispata TaxID=231223 RepID=A0AAE1A3U4_9GAST|nr:hypothetical protein RRG08_050703 [Elysia crispata]